jgi:hypothetical protein
MNLAWDDAFASLGEVLLGARGDGTDGRAFMSLHCNMAISREDAAKLLREIHRQARAALSAARRESLSNARGEK